MRKYIYFIALICCALSASTSYAQKKVIKTMMIAGQDGSHYWRGACEAMKQILENSGMFKVDFVFTPDFGGDIPLSPISLNITWLLFITEVKSGPSLSKKLSRTM